MDKVRSPLTYSENVLLEKQIHSSKIINYYNLYHNIDITDLFHNISSISIYKCLDTGYKFFHPFNISGNSQFYECLQQYEWYYMDWKWEYEIVKNMLNGDELILEIGCGKGAFLNKLNTLYKNIYCTGLELNEKAVYEGIKKNVNLLNQTIQNYSKEHCEMYDVVCSFQVMEHIAEVRDVITASLYTLKKGGKLIICVPNNNSFIQYDENNYLNMPPHHMGLWNKESLIKIQSIFNIKLSKLIYEPLQYYHFNWYHQLFIRKLNAKSGFIAMNIDKYIRDISIDKFYNYCNKYIKGHSILAVYTKK